MKRLIDIVNFNADASCLEAAVWLSWLEGGDTSAFCRWLRLYIDRSAPIVLGLTGASAADLSEKNPEAIRLINHHPDIFQIILRPFAHDAALLRTTDGFRINLALGYQLLNSLFDKVYPAFLPPEFMLTAEQSMMLADAGTELTFVNALRLETGQQDRIPASPYKLACPMGRSLVCVPVQGLLTKAYLTALDFGNAAAWNEALADAEQETLFCWRDGETVTLFPQGLERETRWLAAETGIVRCHLSLDHINTLVRAPASDRQITSYPQHSLVPWMREFKLLGYVQALREHEATVANFDLDTLTLWFYAITSDVLSAVEKDSIPKALASLEIPGETIRTEFLRCDRGFEGASCLTALGHGTANDRANLLRSDPSPWMQKLRLRRAAIARHLTISQAGDLTRI